MGTGRYAASQKDVYLSQPSVTGVRGVIYLHGANNDGTACRDYNNAGELHLVNAIAEFFPVLSIDAAGPTAFGNSAAVTDVGSAVTYAQGTLGWKSGTVLLVGGSMGFITAMNYTKANPTKVGCVVGVIPGIDLNDVVTNNRGGFAAAVNTAYGGTYSEVTNGPTSNPVNYAASITTPIRLFNASDDALAVPSTVAAFTAGCASATATSVGALGHTQAAIEAAPRDQILAFLKQYA
jgi:hypothetical protein